MCSSKYGTLMVPVIVKDLNVDLHRHPGAKPLIFQRWAKYWFEHLLKFPILPESVPIF
jgi:hypothetical protein